MYGVPAMAFRFHSDRSSCSYTVFGAGIRISSIAKEFVVKEILESCALRGVLWLRYPVCFYVVRVQQGCN